MNSFFERYQPVFEIVARMLGNGWREVWTVVTGESLQRKREQKQILKGMSSQLVQLESWYVALTGVKAENGLNGQVIEHGDSYDIKIRGLSMDQLVKVTGYLKQL
ncbi:TPA: hypothetical protein RPE44_004412 [Salmonella enterica]|nr:hypothetical protein [Salmonella enterica]ECJ8167985.1 hypothetical protein [Salmonella enterica]ECQ3583625.1 hypothetical protein [Salmonella enterica]EGF1823834.1 hypothetical protein [Salmonella enterica]EGF2625911.1 hypothetical protein [Salmonella enterica]